MTDNSIEGLLRNLKKTLEVHSSEKIDDVKEPFVKSYKDESVFVLKKSFESNSANSCDKNDPLREKVISVLEVEVSRFVKEFCSSDDGMSYIKKLISLSIENQDDFLKNSLKEEITNKIQEALTTK